MPEDLASATLGEYPAHTLRKPNEFKHRPDGVTELHLKGGFVALIDTADFPLLSKYRWHAHKARNPLELWYAKTFVRRYHGGFRQVSMHRMLVKTKEPNVDHKNGDGLDNRRSNLRAANQSTNCFNRRKKSVGYYWHKKDQRWVAHICVDRQRIRIGGYKSEQEARHARFLAECVYHPEVVYA